MTWKPRVRRCPLPPCSSSTATNRRFFRWLRVTFWSRHDDRRSTHWLPFEFGGHPRVDEKSGRKGRDFGMILVVSVDCRIVDSTGTESLLFAALPCKPRSSWCLPRWIATKSPDTLQGHSDGMVTTAPNTSLYFPFWLREYSFDMFWFHIFSFYSSLLSNFVRILETSPLWLCHI